MTMTNRVTTERCPDCGLPVWDGWHVVETSRDLLLVRGTIHVAPPKFRRRVHADVKPLQNQNAALAQYIGTVFAEDNE